MHIGDGYHCTVQVCVQIQLIITNVVVVAADVVGLTIKNVSLVDRTHV